MMLYIQYGRYQFSISSPLDSTFPRTLRHLLQLGKGQSNMPERMGLNICTYCSLALLTKIILPLQALSPKPYSFLRILS